MPAEVNLPECDWTGIAALDLGAFGAEWPATAGFVVQRGFTRMILDRSAPFGDPGLVYAAVGPELG